MDWEKYFDRIYSNYDRYIIIPVILFLGAAGVLAGNQVMNGEVVSKGLDFTGGTEFIFNVEEDFSADEVETVLEQNGRPNADVTREVSESGTAMIVRLPDLNADESELTGTLTSAGYSVALQKSRGLSSAVSSEFFLQAQLAFLMAFTIMSLVIFYAFKDLTPSLAVIFAALGDILFAMAGMAVFGINLTLGSLAALLMLIGYSVDTDIVLSTRVLRQDRKSLKHRIWSSIKTGVTMSSGGIAGFTLLYIVSVSIVGSSELSQIAAVMVIGLIADIPFTYFGNALILKKYVEGDFRVLGEWFPWS